MAREDYSSVNLPVTMLNAVQKLISGRPGLGYRSRDEFIREATRTSLLKHGVEIPANLVPNSDLKKGDPNADRH